MATRAAKGYEWTSAEVQTLQGFYVGPGNKNVDTEEPTFLVVRYQDERSSDLCKQMEAMAFSQGGLVIKDQGAIQRGLSTEYRTGLFHNNCRCRLVIKPKATGEETDETDLTIASTENALSNSELERATQFLGEKMAKKYTSFGYRKRVANVLDVNLSGKHYRHDRRMGR